uniref:DUF3719 domain-containing protein n=1 Tax=Panagrellus redivivus TaxID=6233 RepID=A0A7E4V763_PANRE
MQADQWSTSNFGEDSQSLDSDNLSTTAAQLKAIVSGFVDVKQLEATGQVRAELMEEARLWEEHFPSLSITGKQIRREKEVAIVSPHTTTERLAVARRTAVGSLMGDIQKLIKTELGPSLPMIAPLDTKRSQSTPTPKQVNVDLPKLEDKK